MASSLERYCADFGFGIRQARIIESNLLLEFRRCVAAYAPGVPATDDPQELLALMQHHGTPTRLLDWTYSPFIATYFALETARGAAAVWALNTDWLDREARRVVPVVAAHLPTPEEYDKRRDGETFLKLFMPYLLPEPRRSAPFMYTVNPRVLNTRLSIQQGVFTAAGDVARPLAKNLSLYRNVRANVVRVVISKEVGREILPILHRMGIDRASLYPGLDGFAWSLRTRMHALRTVRSRIQQWYS